MYGFVQVLKSHFEPLVWKPRESEQRKSILDLVISRLSGVLGMSPLERLAYLPAGPQKDEYFEGLLKRVQEGGELATRFLKEASATDAEFAAICEMLGDLVSDKNAGNQWEQQFQLGRRFGELRAACYEFEIALSARWENDRTEFRGDCAWRPIGADNFRRQCEEFIERSLADSLLAKTTTARIAVESLATHLEKTVNSVSEFEGCEVDSDFQTLVQLANLRDQLARAEGAILARLSADDEECYRANARSPFPREALWPHQDSQHAVEQICQLAVLAMAGQDKKLTNPNDVFSMLVVQIEKLVRETWPSECLQIQSRDHRSGVKKLLDDKISQASGPERRFAKLAKHLYDVHRNETVHQNPNFQRSWQEAFSFITNMRQLLDLSTQIRGKT